jgi:hypothetical protein
LVADGAVPHERKTHQKKAPDDAGAFDLYDLALQD